MVIEVQTIEVFCRLPLLGKQHPNCSLSLLTGGPSVVYGIKLLDSILQATLVDSRQGFHVRLLMFMVLAPTSTRLPLNSFLVVAE